MSGASVQQDNFEGWEEIRRLFEDDSGIFPEICICNLAGEAVVAAFSHIKSITKGVVGKPYFFDRRDGIEKSLLAEENPAGLVVKGEAEPFHFLIRGLEISGARLPDLGVFILQNAVSLDFEPGQEWRANQAWGLLTLLKHLSSLGEKSSSPAGPPFLRLEEIISPEIRRDFLRIFSELQLQP